MSVWALPAIVFIEFCERIGYYTFQGTQKSWLQDQGYGNAQSSSLNQTFGLLSYVSCFFGGWLADSSFGRYKTIAYLCVVYVAGCIMACVAAHPQVESIPLYFVGTFVLIALGTGGIKPNVCNFGADQIDPDQPDADAKTASFFMYFYLTINLGAMVAFGFLATAATNGLPPLVPEEDGYFFAYSIAAGFMAIATFTFLAATRLYRKESLAVNAGDPVLALCARALWSGRGKTLGKVALLGWTLIPILIVVSVVNAFVVSMAMTIIVLVLDISCIACLVIAHRNNEWLGSKDAVTQSLDCVPKLLVGNVVFNVLYNTMASVFYSQACQMDTRIGPGSSAAQLNGAFFNLADSLAIILFTPVIAQIVIPCSERCLGRKVSLNMKIYAGILVAVAAQLLAAGMEYFRLRSPVLDIQSKCAPLMASGGHVHMSELSAWWMVIPYAMVGIGEILVNPSLQHFAYDGAHPSMRSLIQAFCLFAMGGMPNALSSAMSMATAEWTPNDLNQGNLPLVYMINALIGLVGCLVFRWVSRERLPLCVKEEASESDSSEDEAASDNTLS